MQQVYNIGLLTTRKDIMWPRIQDGGRLFKLVCASFVDVGKLQKLWKDQTLIHNWLF